MHFSQLALYELTVTEQMNILIQKAMQFNSMELERRDSKEFLIPDDQINANQDEMSQGGNR